MSSQIGKSHNTVNRHVDDGNSYATSRSQRSNYRPVYKNDIDNASDVHDGKSIKTYRGNNSYSIDDEEDDDASENELHRRLNDRKPNTNPLNQNDRDGNNNSDNFYHNNNDSGAYSDIDLDGVEDQEERRRTQRLQHENTQLNQPRINHERRRNPCCAAFCPTWNDIKSYCYNCTAPKGEYRGIWYVLYASIIM
jgi:hypothetical protein